LKATAGAPSLRLCDFVRVLARGGVGNLRLSAQIRYRAMNKWLLLKRVQR
jgi:hypothetical protein